MPHASDISGALGMEICGQDEVFRVKKMQRLDFWIKYDQIWGLGVKKVGFLEVNNRNFE